MFMAEKTTTDKIKKDMTLGEVLTRYPKAAEVLAKHGFHCVGCPATFMETVEQGAKVHGITGKKLEKLLKEMNDAVSKK